MSIKLDMTTVKAANLTASDNGRWIIWQADPGVCLGIGDTYDAARANAMECGVGADHIDDDDLDIDTLEITDKKRKTVDEILDIAGTSYSELAIKQHETNYTKLIVQVEDGDVVDAFLDETIDRYDRRENGWTCIYTVGTGSAPCNCDACMDGDEPSDWAGSETDGIEEEIERGLSEALNNAGV